MKLYWLWFLFHAVIWMFSFAYFAENMSEMIWRLLSLSIYFILFFIMPLVKQNQMTTMIFLTVNSLISILMLFPQQQESFNPFLLFILSLLIGEAYFRLSNQLATIVAGVSVMGVVVIILNLNPSITVISFIMIYFILFFTIVILYKQTKNENDDLFARYDALLSEYRELKRRLASKEETTRQEERVLIGHEIHDSVGHKLTALLMQLEVYRLKASEDDKAQVESLKALATESLEETRSAVKVLKSNDVGGLPGILRLIRKLETESFIRIHFSVKHGAFAVPLIGEQSFVIYRSVQEALTNIMKHSNAREAEIMFDAPGGSMFRFEISNPVKDNNRFQEGFGLVSMRERMEKIGGELHVEKIDGQFIVRGILKLREQEEAYDSNTTGRRSSDGSRRIKNDDGNG
ncbi:hypothetical protein BTS2_1182 [Bacillus sp. TS-2]|nr:hypothetical protein BTS2_1182 [Bacillus sp. TS-2]